MQLQGSNNAIENNAKLFESMNEMISNLKDSVDDTKRYKENIAELASNLESLNTVYGNMLSAMNFSK
jgi:methyl-accepting chemotaxis protein